MGKAIISGNVINEDMPLNVAVVGANPGKHSIDGNQIDREHPLAVAIIGGLTSIPPSGKYRVVNLYVDPETEKLTVEYEDISEP